MRAGKLRQWVTFERLVTEVDSDGSRVEAWVDAFDVNASMPVEIQQMSARELIAAQAVQSKVTTRIIARHRDGFEPKMRAVVRRRGEVVAVYHIEGVIADHQSMVRYVTLMCTTGVNDGQ